MPSTFTGWVVAGVGFTIGVAIAQIAVTAATSALSKK